MNILYDFKKVAILLGYLLSSFCVLKLLLWYTSGTYLYFEPFILLPLLIGCVGVIKKKEWGRKGVVIIGAIGFVYYLVDATFLSIGNNIDALIGILACMFGFSVYQQPLMKKIYQNGFDKPHWTILIVDDDKVFLKLLKTNFNRNGISVLTAETGEKGLKVAQKRRPDLIILDVILPGLKGRNVCAKLKEDSRTNEIPIIFLTVQDSKDDVKAEIEAGAILHLTKPVDFKVLFSEVQKILGS